MDHRRDHSWDLARFGPFPSTSNPIGQLLCQRERAVLNLRLAPRKADVFGETDNFRTPTEPDNLLTGIATGVEIGIVNEDEREAIGDVETGDDDELPIRGETNELN